MHCKELVKGKKWVCVADGPRDPVSGQRKQISRRGKTKSEAKKKVDEAIQQLTHSGVDVKLAQKMKFHELADTWLEEYVLTGAKNSSVSSREWHISLLNQRFGRMRLSDITLKVYQNALNDMFKKDFAISSLRNTHAAATMIFSHAVRHKILQSNPVKGAYIPKKIKTIEEIENNEVLERFFERSELEEFLSIVATAGLPLDLEYFHVGAFSGMRPGEICALKWTDVNFELNTIKVTKTIYSKTNNIKKYELTPPKTSNSIREIEMDEGVMDMLHKLQERQELVKQKYSSDPDYHDENFVFARYDGYPYLVNFFVHRMKRIMKKTSIKKHATPHILRHTHISMLTEAGADLTYIMDRVGHKNAKTTRDVYTHISKDMKKTINENMHKKFGSIIEKSISERIESEM